MYRIVLDNDGSGRVIGVFLTDGPGAVSAYCAWVQRLTEDTYWTSPVGVEQADEMLEMDGYGLRVETDSPLEGC